MRKTAARLAQGGLAKLGVRLARLERCVEPVMPFDALELAIMARLHHDPAGFYFVQIGANVGIRSDSLHPLVRRLGLAGCVVEHDPIVFERLVVNYADQPQLDLRNLRVAEIAPFPDAGKTPEALSFAALAASLRTSPIALLYVDTEGANGAVIRAAFDAGVHPAIIVYEWTEISIERRRDLKLLLLDQGYRFIDVGADTVCIRQEFALDD